jgi:hypothetical protein
VQYLQVPTAWQEYGDGANTDALSVCLAKVPPQSPQLLTVLKVSAFALYRRLNSNLAKLLHLARGLRVMQRHWA